MATYCLPIRLMSICSLFVCGGYSLYFPRPEYHISVPTDLEPQLEPFLPLHTMYQGDGTLNYKVECNFIFTPCDLQLDQSSCNVTCSSGDLFTIHSNGIISVVTPNLAEFEGYTFSLTVKAVFVKSVFHREEAFTKVFISVKPNEDLPPCPACFLEDTEYFLNSGTGLSRRTFATMTSVLLRRKCAHTEARYSLHTDHNMLVFPFGVDPSTAALSIKEPLDGHTGVFRFSILCHAVDESHSNSTATTTTTTKTDVSVTLLTVDQNAPVVIQEDVIAQIVKNRFKNDTVPVPGLEVLDDDITFSDDYNVTIQEDNCSLFRIGNIVTRTEPCGRGKYRTRIQTHLVLKESVSSKAKMCQLHVRFTDRRYNLLRGRSSSVSLNVLVDFKAVPFQFENESYQVSVYKNASALTQVLTTNLPKYVSDRPLSYSIVYPNAHEFGLRIESNKGVIYVENTASLKAVTKQNVRFEVKASDGVRIAMTNISIEFISPGEDSTDCDTEPKQCSIFDKKRDCERACGIGSPTGKCVWLDMRGRGSVYSTCTPNKDTCPDNVCDVWEQANPQLCLQDCVEGSRASGSLEPAERGIRGKGICYCTTGLSCYCVKHDPTIPTIGNSQQVISTTVQYGEAHTVGNQVFPIETVEQASVCDRNCKTLLSFGLCSGSLILIVAIVTLRYNQKKKRRRSPKKYNGKDIGSNISISAIPSDYLDDTPPLVQEVTESWHPSHSRFYKTDYDPKWEFSRSNLVFEKVIGEGEFGRVIKAQALNIRGLTGYTPVAVKMIKNGASSSELRDLMTELHLLKQVNHPNVIKLLGCCTHKGPLYLIVEFCSHGSLRHYLRETRRLETLYVQDQYNLMINGETTPAIEETVTARDLMSFAWQICKGMMYLTEMKLVHRDLATRNVLVAEEKIMKISDFGLTRDIYESDAYLKKSKGRIPVKWMAVESLYDQLYTTKSDVWSFGVLLWEVITLGATPYPGIPPERLFHILKTGYRMERPDNCSEELYDIMLRCWRTDPKERPNFYELGKIFEQMLEQNGEYLDLSNGLSHSEGEGEESDDDEVKVSLLSSESEDGSQGRTSDESLYGEIKFLTLSRSCSDIQKVRNEQNKMTELPQRPRCHSSTIPKTYNTCGSTEV